MPNLLENLEAFQAWRDQPQTRDFLNLLKRRRQGLMEQWARGAGTLESQASAVLLGRLGDLSHDDILEMLGIEVSND
jgi:hypothetical protein